MLPFARAAMGGYRGITTPSRPMLRPVIAPSVVRALSKAPNYPAAGTVAKLKWLVSEYGAVGVCTHFSIYFATLGGLFLGVDNGVRGPHAPLRTHARILRSARSRAHARLARARAPPATRRPAAGVFGRRRALDAKGGGGR